MILTCASCLTRYYADDAAIGSSGRSVRCAACGHTWFAEAVSAVEEAAIRAPALTRETVARARRVASEPGPAPSAAARFRAQQSERMRQERIRAVGFAWAGTGAAIAASATGAVLFRQDIAEFWPRSASAYAAVGLDVNVYGLELDDISVERAFDGATPVLLVSGEVRNIGHEEKEPPPLRFTLRDGESNELYQVVHALEAGAIAPGAVAPFQVRLDDPPADAVDLEAAFASYGEPNSPLLAAQPSTAPEQPLVLGPEDMIEEPQAALDDLPGLRLEAEAANEGHG
jgi:predicted Zn finger-like uncharacterized protein